MPALRPFQREDVEFLKKHNLKALVASAPGTGKTAVSLRSLVESKGTFPALVVCPASVTRNWAKEALKWAKGIRTVIIEDMDSRIRLKPGPPTLFIISWSLLDARWVDLVRLKIQSVIADECFPEGTLIAAQNGQIPIEKVQPGDKVWSLNEKTGQIELQRVTRHITKQRVNPLVRVLHDQGELITTSNHKIRTEQGYGSAETVAGRSVYLLPEDVCPEVPADSNVLGTVSTDAGGIQESTARNDRATLSDLLYHVSGERGCQPEALLPDMCVSTSGEAANPVRLEDMCLVFDGLSGYGTQKPEILLEKLFGQMENDSAGNSSDYESIDSQIRTDTNRDQTTGRFCPHEDQKPYAESCERRKDAQENGWSNLSVQGWQRDPDTSTEGDGELTVLADGTCDSNQTGQKSISEFASGLQSGFSTCRTEDCGGNRRKNAHGAQMEILGCPQNQSLESVRVGSVEVYEQGSRHGSTESSGCYTRVYDLEVEGNHNYFANRVLVSNCHYAKNPASLRASALFKITQQAKHVLLLSGTPIVNSKSELSALHELLGIENPPMLRRLLEDVAPDIPPKARSYLNIKLRPEQEQEYNKANEDFENWLLQRKQLLLGEGLAQAEVDRTLAAEALAKIGYLRRLIGEAKVPACSDFIARAVRVGEPVVCFVEHQGALEKLSRSLAKQRIRHEILDGSVGPKRRQEIVEAFQRYDFPVFIGTRAAKEGITLTAARHLVFLERFFTSADEEQCEDRIRRIGQKFPTTIWFLHASGTVDDRVDQIVRGKRALVRTAIGAATVEETPLATVEELITRWQDKIDDSGIEFVGLGLGEPLPPLPSPKQTHAITFHGSEWNLQKAVLWCKMNGYLPSSKTDLNDRFKLIIHPPQIFNKNKFKVFSVSKTIKVIHGERLTKANERRVRNNLRGLSR